MPVERNVMVGGKEYFAPVPVAEELDNLRRALCSIVGQLHAVHAVDQVPFLKGAIGAAIQIAEPFLTSDQPLGEAP